MFDKFTLQNAYHQLPHGEKLRVISRIINLSQHDIHCEIAPQRENPLWEDVCLISSFSCIEYAAQAAAIHGIFLGVKYDPLRPAYIAAVKNVQLACGHYNGSETIELTAEQEYHAQDGAIYQFRAHAQGELIISGRLVLKIG